jgi:RNA polymerase sigma factor (sigma-70 family)
MQDDSELLRQYAGRASDEAFTELVRRHIGAVYAVALRRVGGDAHLAEDVTQEVFADLARKAGSVADREAVLGWLFVATRFAAAKKVRREQQRQSLEWRILQMSEREDALARKPDWDGIRPVLDEAIHALGRRDREAVLLHFFGKRTFGDMGAMFSLSESGARMRVERALLKLRLSLGRRGITSTTAALAVALGGQVSAEVPASLATSVTATALAAGHSSGLALLYLMSITKTQLSAAIAVVLAGASIVGVVQHREITALLAERQAASNESALNKKRASELAGKLAANEVALAKLRMQLSTLKAGGGSPVGNAPSNFTASGVKVIHLKDIIREHPEYAALWRKENRREVIREYSRAIAALNLSPGKADQLKELLIERDMSKNDAEMALADAGLLSGTEEAGKAVSAATKDSDQAIVSLIGNESNERLEALKGTSNYGSQTDIDDIALDMVDAGQALSADQSLALAQFQHDAGNSARNPDAASPGYREVDPTTWQSPLDQQFFANAATILTPAQLQILKASRSENNQRHAIMKQYWGNSPAMVMY